MNEQEKLLWKLYFLELGYNEDLIDRVINNISENRPKMEVPKLDNTVIRQAPPPWEKGNTISIEEKQRRDKLKQAVENTKRSIVRDLTVGMGTNDPRMQEGVAAFNAQHVYNPTAAFEWGFPVATALGLGTGYMLGDLAGEQYGETGRTLGGLVGGFIGGGINNPTLILPKTNVTPTLALMWLLNRAKPRTGSPMLNVGWGPRLTMEVSHLSELPITQFRVYNPDLWGAAAEGLNPLGIWFSPRQLVGTPRMNPRKRLKAARARATFLTRPYEIQGDLTLDKPIVTIGDVPNRSALEYMAEQGGADGVIFNNIYDNGFDATTSIKSFKEPEITRIVNRPRIEYYGPTMGKSTFVRENPNLPFDDADRLIFSDGLWNKRKELASNLGINARDFGTNRVPEEIANSPQYKAAMQEYVASILDSMGDYVANPANKGRTLLTSNKYVLDPNNKIFLYNEPTVPDFNTFLERNQRRGFRETPELALEWWNNIASLDVTRIDNRYVSEILGPRSLNLRSKTVSRKQSTTTDNSGTSGFQALYRFYNTLAYRLRVKEAYPYWSDARVQAFILDKLDKVLRAMKIADYSRSGEELGAGGLTTIVNEVDGQYPKSVQIGYDVGNPRRVAIHEGLHFSSRGGRNVSGGKTDPNAAAIADYNERIMPEMTRSNYKEYLETPNKEAFRKQYKEKVKQYFPDYTEDLLDYIYEIMLEEGAYYNHLDELRSFGLTDVIDAWDRGEIKSLNDETEIYKWLVEAWNHDRLEPDFVRTLTDYRTDFDLWAKFITKALSVVSVPTIKAFLNLKLQNENN